MRDRFLGEEVWARLDLPVAETTDHVRNSETQRLFRGFLFQRIVPVLRDIGMLGPKVRVAFEDMGVMGFVETDLDALVAEDDAVAHEFDRAAHVRAVAASVADE
jgi:hypothetical protein